MKTDMGVWIDHHNAVLISVDKAGEETGRIISRVERKFKRGAAGEKIGTNGNGRRQPLDDQVQKAFTEHINVFYDTVISCLKNARSLLIFGPGEAKLELRKRIAKKHPELFIEITETAGKMTERQMAANVRLYFTNRRSARGLELDGLKNCCCNEKSLKVRPVAATGK